MKVLTTSTPKNTFQGWERRSQKKFPNKAEAYYRVGHPHRHISVLTTDGRRRVWMLQKNLWNPVASLCETASGVSLCSPQILLGRANECLFNSVCAWTLCLGWENVSEEKGLQQNGWFTFSCSDRWWDRVERGATWPRNRKLQAENTRSTACTQVKVIKVQIDLTKPEVTLHI